MKKNCVYILVQNIKIILSNFINLKMFFWNMSFTCWNNNRNFIRIYHHKTKSKNKLKIAQEKNPNLRTAELNRSAKRR